MKEIKPDEFGDIRKITVKQSYDIEPIMMMAARGPLTAWDRTGGRRQFPASS